MKCVNCGKPGHKAEGCTERKKVGLERPCFICGKPGHRAAECPDRASTKVVVKDQGESGNSYSMCVVAEGAFEPVVSRKPVPKGVAMGDYLKRLMESQLFKKAKAAVDFASANKYVLSIFPPSHVQERDWRHLQMIQPWGSFQIKTSVDSP